MPASNSDFDISLAIVWERILNLSHENFFDGFSHAVIDREHGHDKLPQPGYVGRSYRPGGLILIGQNPGNGGDGLTLPDRCQYQLLYNLRNAKGSSDRVKAYRKLMDTLETEVMITWKIVQNVVIQLLHDLGITFDKVAYLNLMKFRTKDNRPPPSKLYERSWPITVEQLNALSPGLVVALGRGAYRKFKSRYHGSANHDCVTRRYSSLPPQGQLDIERIGKCFQGKL